MTMTILTYWQDDLGDDEQFIIAKHGWQSVEEMRQGLRKRWATKIVTDIPDGLKLEEIINGVIFVQEITLK